MISGATRLAGVIGSPIRHSLSPLIMNAAFEASGLDWRYVAFEVAPGNGREAVDAMRTLGIEGLSVTMPHKGEVIAGLDHLDPAAEKLGAVNCIAREGELLVGHNTDGAGFVAALAADLEIDVEGKSFGVLGAGGAARAIIAELGARGAATVVVVNRNIERGRTAAALSPVAHTADASVLSEVDVLVNATSVGMGEDGAMPIPVDLLDRQTVVDIVYEPRRTPLLAAAAERGLPHANGVGMLVHQAAVAFERWTARTAPVDAMTNAVLQQIDRKS